MLILSSFTALLDGGKTGVLLKPGVKKKDDEADRKIKDRPSPGFILTILRKFGKRLSNDALAQYDRRIDQLSKKPSPDDPLLLPLKSVEALITQAKARSKRTRARRVSLQGREK
ncbi:hypothetical protein PM082_012750 [Marasmius tenuissimus]|nr:hypothetical protein PM082_012750 [Marasmius tenuissimus]